MYRFDVSPLFPKKIRSVAVVDSPFIFIFVQAKVMMSGLGNLPHDVHTCNAPTLRTDHARMFRFVIGAWLSLVEHLVRDQGVGGSNPLAPIFGFSKIQPVSEYLRN